MQRIEITAGFLLDWNHSMLCSAPYVFVESVVTERIFSLAYLSISQVDKISSSTVATQSFKLWNVAKTRFLKRKVPKFLTAFFPENSFHAHFSLRYWWIQLSKDKEYKELLSVNERDHLNAKFTIIGFN